MTSGALVQVSVCNHHHAVGVNKQEELWEYYKGNWVKLPGQATNVSVDSSGYIWCVNSACNIYHANQ